MPPILTSENLTLRPATVADVALRFGLGAEPDQNLRHYGIQPTVVGYTLEDAQRWVQSLMDHPNAWIIVGQSLLGSIRLDMLNAIDRRASLAVGLLRIEDQGRGLGTEAVRCVLAYAFDDLHLHRISVRVLADNGPAIRSYEKCGFRVEGRERETVCLDNEWRDDLIMGLLRHEFRRADVDAGEGCGSRRE